MTQNMTNAIVIGTTSATVIQSMPSMKLVRLMNQMPATSMAARSIHHGSIGTSRNSAGAIAITMPAAMPCRSRRGSGASARMSSTAPTTASSAVAMVRASNWFTALPDNSPAKMATPTQATAKVEAITAAPPPCGVGSRCEERALGDASAWVLSHDHIARINPALIIAASRASGTRNRSTATILAGSFMAFPIAAASWKSLPFELDPPIKRDNSRDTTPRRPARRRPMACAAESR